MLKKLLILSCLSLANITYLPADTTSPNRAVSSNIDQQMNQAVQNAEKNVQQLLTNATRTDVAPTWDSKLQLENAIIQLEVKKTLVENFRGAISLNSPVVRQRLLEVLNKDSITQADIAELQSLINQYKATLESSKTGSTGPTGLNQPASSTGPTGS